MTTVVISPSNVVHFPDGGGHFWVYMQYVYGLREIGVDVFWLEEFHVSGDPARDAEALAIFHERMARFGLSGRTLLYSRNPAVAVGEPGSRAYIGMSEEQAEALFARTDLLLNFYYALAPDLLARFRRSALVDIDPGLLQFWIAQNQLHVSPHDLYFSTGETVGTPGALFPDCGLKWEKIRPPVSLSAWPCTFDAGSKNFTTVSGWWGGGGKGEFITDGDGLLYENNKRVTFLQFLDLPRRTSQSIELALNLGEGDLDEDECAAAGRPAAPGERVTDYVSDAVDRRLLEGHGWGVRHASEVSSTPEDYQRYIQGSRGEMSCVKPSCIRFQNAWISDRTLCYLASGKPVVVQDTGPSQFLPNGAGMFRFSTIDEAVRAFESINADYKKHCGAARQIAEELFDARVIVRHMLTVAC
jgi:hypothetical protein